ncbi:MAG: M15 family metallopeptidase, partial [Pseudomonadota bacterium]
YGDTRSDVARSLRTVKWFGQRLSVTKRHGAANALQRVANELGKLPGSFRKYYAPSAGTFNWRRISGTSRLSFHSFGAAIDINISFSDYWRWAREKPGRVSNYRNRIPPEVVAAFEKHGFIWGGRWYHYDTMHFEYRPALIAIGRLAEERGC